ncbi:LmbU family transcriptional regulator [Microbispora sp. NEAU-D428]|uniref:LmbU family transcriptional regulator n=1 Tax=Microbispora sitophila TaxID=2771537 RepID=UPI001D035063|nr:LmbU family transcriptional regulator [Microbispora sitophila]MBE3015291.1 LmbU family transcriptional regulator [Microbispora sitophila]
MAMPLLDPVPKRGEERGTARRGVGDTRRHSPQERLGLDASVRAGRLGLRLPVDLSFESWQRIGSQLCVIANSSTWWLGDWLVYGEEFFSDRYRMAIAKTSLSYKTLRNYAWVARKFPMSRRRDTLSLQHHAEVAALPEDEQELWLTRAEKEGWPQSRLRKEIQASRSRGQDADMVTVTISVEVSSEQEERWKAAAQVASVPLPEWIATTLDRAAVKDGDPE